MLSIFNNVRQNAANKEKAPLYNGNREECLKIFVPGPMIKLYRQLKEYIEKNGKKPPSSTYLPDAVTSSILAWTGTAATNQLYASAVVDIIEKFLIHDLQDLLLFSESKLQIPDLFKPSLLKDVFLAARELPKILASMPTETITLTYIKTGSEVRRAITTAISSYENALKALGFPNNLDVHNTDEHQLSTLLKNY
ncbi:MAG: hypothetical protein P4M14_10305 [Gammaproteobacteria bacterium]|nr:hypothetical protein [Gammaproteobacteria bacterium]